MFIHTTIFLGNDFYLQFKAFFFSCFSKINCFQKSAVYENNKVKEFSFDPVLGELKEQSTFQRKSSLMGIGIEWMLLLVLPQIIFSKAPTQISILSFVPCFWIMIVIRTKFVLRKTSAYHTLKQCYPILSFLSCVHLFKVSSDFMIFMISAN